MKTIARAIKLRSHITLAYRVQDRAPTNSPSLSYTPGLRSIPQTHQAHSAFHSEHWLFLSLECFSLTFVWSPPPYPSDLSSNVTSSEELSLAISSNVAQRHSYSITLFYCSAQHFCLILFFVVFSTHTLLEYQPRNSKALGGTVYSYTPITYNSAWHTESL